MSGVVDNPEDFSRYFSGSYIARRENGLLVPFYVRAQFPVDNGRDAQVELYEWIGGRKLNSLVRFSTILEQYKITCPRLGTISTSDSVVYITLVPSRQYKKGLAEERVKIHRFMETPKLPMFHDLVTYIFNPVYFPPEVLLKKLEDGERIGGALSPNLGIFVSNNARYPMLVYKNNVVGEIKEDEVKLLNAYSPHKDYITKKMAGFKIKVWGS